MDESGLAVRAASGDHAAFEVLVRRHSEPLWRLARSLMRDDPEAEDAVQEAFMKAYLALASFERRSSFRTWLHTICYRECMDRLRVQRANVVPLHTIAPPATNDAAPETRLVVERLLQEMPSDEREAFVLVHLLGYSREEASRICGAPASTVRSRVTRARLRLGDPHRTRRCGRGGSMSENEHARFRRLLAEDRLTPDATRHPSRCSSCSAFSRRFEGALARASGTLPSMPAGLPERVLTSVRELQREAREALPVDRATHPYPPTSSGSRRRWLAAAAAVVVAALVAVRRDRGRRRRRGHVIRLGRARGMSDVARKR